MLAQVREAGGNVFALRSVVSQFDISVAPSGAIAVHKEARVPAHMHVLVRFYADERDRLVRYSDLCIKAGAEERRVRLAGAEAQRLSAAT